MSVTASRIAAPKPKSAAQNRELPPARALSQPTKARGVALKSLRQTASPANSNQRFSLPDSRYRRTNQASTTVGIQVPSLNVSAGSAHESEKPPAVLWRADETQLPEVNELPQQLASNIENTVTNKAGKGNLTVSKNASEGAVIQFTQQRTLPSVAPPVITLHRSAGKPVSSHLLKKLDSTTINSSGAPLPVAVRNPLSRSFSIDLTPIRVHTDARAQRTVKGFNTRAFAYGNHIFLGPGESPTDLRLMSHEVAHVVQQSGGAVLQHFTTSHGDAFENEAEQASATAMRGDSFNVRQRTSPRPQGLLGIDLDISIPDPLDWIAGKANAIPGFRMFTIVLGVNPINMSSVDRSAANILRALVEFMPGGSLITEALDNHGVFEKAGAFVETQIDSLGMTGESIKAAVTEFIDKLNLPGDLISPGSTWERAKRIFTDPIDRIISFASGLVDAIIEMIKDAILKPIAKLAEGTEGYNLLKGVLGFDPITDEPVTPSAETLLGPLLKMIGLGDVWQKMQDAKAIPRAWQWFQSTISALVGFVSEIPTLFLTAFKSLTLEDIILVPKAFAKLAAVFGGFMSKFVSWGVDAMFKLLEIVFDVVSPGAFGYVKKTGAALKSILQNPLPFVGNLVKAAKLGFTNFGANFLTHLKKGLIDWLTGSLQGVYIPKALTLPEFGKLALSVLGISWAQIRAKIVKALGPNGEMIMTGLEALFDVVKALKDGGPAAAWEVIKDKLTGLKDQIVSGITSFVVEAVVTKAIPKLIAMFIPGAGFISAIISIYDTVMVFVNKISKIIQVVTAFINSIVAIAAGNIGAAAGKVESILGGLLSLAISFLAGFAGLGKVADKVMGVVNKVRATVDKALDTAINFIISKAKKLFAKLFSKKKDEESPEDRLKRAVAELKPAVEAMLAKGSKGLLFKAKLLGWKLKYKLSSLEITGDNLVATVNPSSPVARVVRQKSNEVRTETHAACIWVVSLPEIQKAAEDIVKQKKGGRGTMGKPILVDPRGGLLGAAVAQQQGLATQPFERTVFQIPGAQTPITTLQTFSPSPSHTIVGPKSSPDPVGKYKDYAKHLAARGLTDTDVRVGVALLLAGQPLPDNLKKHEGFIAGLTFLLGSTEPARIPAQAAALPIATQQPAQPSQPGLPHATPAAPVGAVRGNIQADVQAGVPGATPPSTPADPAVVKTVINTQLAQTENAIVAEIESGAMVFSSPAALTNFLKTDLRGMVKSNIMKAFNVGK
jgi:hypothetical protein